MNIKSAFTKERENMILDMLSKDNRVSVDQLAELFNISSGSVRRNLNMMEAAGKLVRTYGGALPMDEQSSEAVVEKRRTSRLYEKSKIAEEARKYIKNGDVIALGGGSTILELAKLLMDLKDSIIATNSITTATVLQQNKDIEVKLSGGTLRAKTGTLIGPEAENFWEYTMFDKAFMGADSISVQYGVTCPNSFEAEIEKRILRNSHEVYILTDSSKLGSRTLVPITPLTKIHCLITDNKADPAFISDVKELGIIINVVKDK